MSTNTTNNTTGSKARKRLRPEEQLEVERKERYDKLLYQAKKALHKEAKVVKSFEVQKVVRHIKENLHPSPMLEERLVALKQFSVDSVVQMCIKRLGIRNLSPHAETEELKSNAVGDAIVEKMLQHKRLGAVMEAWNEKVTEYRRWYLRRKDAVEGVPDFVQELQPKKMKKKVESGPTIFVSLGGLRDEDNDDQDGHQVYGPAGAMEMELKKNRPGQRQRQAKAKALQARKEGRTVEKSLNWREKKNDDENTEREEKVTMKKAKHSNDMKPEKVDAATIANLGKTWKEEGKAHPSWAASAAQKTGIVAFIGKKIKFE